MIGGLSVPVRRGNIFSTTYSKVEFVAELKLCLNMIPLGGLLEPPQRLVLVPIFLGNQCSVEHEIGVPGSGQLENPRDGRIHFDRDRPPVFRVLGPIVALSTQSGRAVNDNAVVAN
jgi:hypothetical protein